MTLLNEPDLQRFVFNHVDWAFYEDVSRGWRGDTSLSPTGQGEAQTS